MLTVITNIILSVMVTITSVKMPVNTLKQEVVMPVEENIMTGSINMENRTESSLLENESYGEKKIQKQESQTGEGIEESQTLDTSVPTSNIVNGNELVSIDADQHKVEKATQALQEALIQAFEESSEEIVGENTPKESAVDPVEIEQPQTQEASNTEQSVACNFTSTEEVASEVVAEVQSYSSEEASPVYQDFRQTFYSVESGEVKVGYGLNYDDSQIRNIDNVMHYYDDEYQWLPIVAVNIDEVLEVGLDERGIPSYYGTILEITYPQGGTQNAIVLDACGACSRDNRIDLWVYSHDYEHDVSGIQYRVVREGFKEDEEQ